MMYYTNYALDQFLKYLLDAPELEGKNLRVISKDFRKTKVESQTLVLKGPILGRYRELQGFKIITDNKLLYWLRRESEITRIFKAINHVISLYNDINIVYNKILRRLGLKVIIYEEVVEVIEAYVILALILGGRYSYYFYSVSYSLRKLRISLSKDFKIYLSERDLETLAIDRFKKVEDKNPESNSREEAKVIVVSLVRSNKKRKVSFLRTENQLALCCPRYLDTPILYSKPYDFKRKSLEELIKCDIKVEKAVPKYSYKIKVSYFKDIIFPIFLIAIEIVSRKCPKEYHDRESYSSYEAKYEVRYSYLIYDLTYEKYYTIDFPTISDTLKILNTATSYGDKSDTRVDFIEIKDYSEINLDKTPIIVLRYGYFFINETYKRFLAKGRIDLVNLKSRLNNIEYKLNSKGAFLLFSNAAIKLKALNIEALKLIISDLNPKEASANSRKLENRTKTIRNLLTITLKLCDGLGNCPEL
ncbi:hypothetical protein N7516_008150 [Penicillium verrucosum]|uniref:uncharacterized protein n=1 Tax=Penicillium verrucosum TaxID=60171 RepID=UPI002545B799|nr:uncharacterized protein N7516_008150 [Penicillium verrucosum]KAJ5926377.1 hypothetical protein N7516_008150 [Penicillium verrucosum]